MGVVRLDCMPAELLSEIAGNLDVYEVLCFTATCKGIRNACLDPLLFKTLIEDQHTLYDFQTLNLDRITLRMHKDANVLARYKYFEPHSDPRHISNWDKDASAGTVQQQFGLDQEIWFRYAVADHRAFQLSNQLNVATDGGNRLARAKLPTAKALHESLQYLPHLLMLKHPSIHAMGLAPAFMKLIELDAPRPADRDRKDWLAPDIPQRLAFSYCATILSQDTPEDAMLNAQDPRAALTKFFLERVRDAAGKLRAATKHACNAPIGATLSQSDAQLIIGSFSPILRRAFREYKVRRLMGSAYYTFTLPFALDIPLASGASSTARLPVPLPDTFASLQPVVPPAATLAWEAWQHAHTASIADPAALSTGTWVGCVAELSPTRRGAIEVDAPVRSLRLRISPDGALRATARDACGPFTLAGHAVDGALRARKTYEGRGTACAEWVARVTPFGIGGVWGHPCAGVGDGLCVQGVLWLWREEWTAPVAAATATAT